MRMAIRFAITFRLADVLKLLNDGDEFDESSRKFFPPEFELKKENYFSTKSFPKKYVFEIKNSSFCISLCKKSYNFSFSIVRILYLCCNIRFKIFYSAFGTRFLKKTRARSTCKYM